MKQARAILWAQWRTLRNFSHAGVAWATMIGFLWYGAWLVAAVTLARLLAAPENLELIHAALPGGLLLIFLYWQVVPLLMAATGASLEMRKLKAYPIPVRQLFAIEVLLRVTAAIEMFMILLGAMAGILFNPRLPSLGALAIVPYMVFNLLLAVGVRDLVVRLLARKRIREFAFLVLVMGAASIQFLVARDAWGGGLRVLAGGDVLKVWPWTAAANLAQGREVAMSLTYLLAWCVIGSAFGLWQFSRTLSFDQDEAGSSRSSNGEVSRTRVPLIERFYRLPSIIWRDPIGALVEKEIRFLARSPRFRLVFLMGFTFGWVIWLPTTFGRNGGTTSFLGSNYLTVVSVYSLLLLSEVCFWNSFGFDRSAAQLYYLAPVPFSSVLIGKNLSALMFIALEILAVTAVCALLGMPLSVIKLTEAFTVAGVVSIFLLGAGNLMSVRQARGVNPDSSFRSGAAGRVQAVLLVVYPIAFVPAGLAYLARYALASEVAFFGVLALDAVVGSIVYKIALESAVESAASSKERVLAALAAGDGPISG
jgi:ABC-2 type transport system permease protein